MPDKGHMETEALLRALEKRIAAEYRKANREITRKVNAYMSEFKRKDKEWREKLENGDITEAEYKAWQTGQVMIGKRWEEMRHTLAQDYANTNDLAKQMAFDSMPDVYALNHNYATFEVEKGGKVDTSYTLYDRPTVERLIRDDPKLLPDPRPGSPLAQKLAKHKELRWEEQHVQSVVLQSILQGESLEETAKRFTQLTEMNYRQSVRYARTATTGAQNAGRVDGYKRAEKLGVDMKQIWLATLDSRTRHEHRVLDGQEVDVGEPFIMDGFKIKYPGDPAAPAHLLYNCRCTVIAKVKGVDFNVSNKTQRDDKIGDMTYEEWKGEHKTAPKPPENVPEGKAVEVKVDKPTKGEYKDEPIKPKFTPAKTIEEAEQIVSQYVREQTWSKNGITSLKGLDIETANKVAETLFNVYEEYDLPQLENLMPMNFRESKWKDSLLAPMAYRDLSMGELYFNPKIMKNSKTFDKYLKDGQEAFEKCKNNIDKFTGNDRKIIETYLKAGKSLIAEECDDAIKATIEHEIGHHIQNQIILKNKEMYEIVSKGYDEYAIKLSGYATKTKGEYIAESFSAYRNGYADLIDPELKKIFDSLRRKR